MGSQRSGRVLVVRDAGRANGADADAADPRDALEAAAWTAEVTAVPSVEAALDRLEGGAVDCVVTAAELDDGSGIELCRRLRAERPGLPIVVHPAAGSERLAGEAVDAGCDAYVPSDATAAELRERVRRVAAPSEAADAGATSESVDAPDEGSTGGAPDERSTGGGRRSRATLERELRELRRSEELHRVTLNHMTDTVLVTNDDGEFVYVCPNVHFIFGYTDAEIREMGTIDELLGPEPVDREALAREGVLTNVECAATDERGEEHVLLVNAREVDIQGGTILYSCRDVTTRKRREEALTALHRTARGLLYAEAADEIAELVVADAADVLDLEASAVFLLEDGKLRPVARSTPMVERCGEPRPFRVNEETPVGYSFLQRESLFLASDDRDERRAGDATTAPEDVVAASLPANPDADVESAAYVPLGDAGVFVAGSADAERFDDVTRELAELLAAAAEAALGRVARESELRAQDRELQRQNRRLTRLDLINEIIREIDAALVRAETREEIERAVCARLTGPDRFAFAWIGAPAPGERTLEVRAWDGDGRGYL
uniref:response regulator n=1 Tax=Halovivax sp. TaxID=1935978 RepID=UPI0025C5188D